MTDKTHHDRTATRASDTWEKERMDDGTALELLSKLRGEGYEARLTVETKPPDSALLMTVDNQEDAEATLENIEDAASDSSSNQK